MGLRGFFFFSNEISIWIGGFSRLLSTVWVCITLFLRAGIEEMGIPDHLNCLLRNLYAGQEATVRTRCGTMDSFQIGKGVCQGLYCHLAYLTYSPLVAQTVKRLPAMQEIWAQSLSQEDPLEKEMATHSSTLAWKIPWMEEPGRW